MSLEERKKNQGYREAWIAQSINGILEKFKISQKRPETLV